MKAVAEVYAPAAGRIIKFNEKLKKNPALINEDPEGEGWIFIMSVDTPEPAHTPQTEHTPEPAHTPQPEHTPEPPRTPQPPHTPQSFGSAQMAARSSLLSPEAYDAYVSRQAEGAEEE